MPGQKPIRDLRQCDPNRRADALVAHAIEKVAAEQVSNPLFAAALDFARPILHQQLRQHLGPRALPQINRAMRDAHPRQQSPIPEAKPDKRADALRVMGLESSATPEDISAAYRAIATLYHPDKFTNKPEELKKFAERKMVELNAAYEVLKGGKR